jgi:hypothetical protein
MIDDRILLFFVIVVLTYVFDHKIFPQIGLWMLSLIEIYLNVTNPLVGQTDVIYIFLFILNICYITYMILTDEQTDGDRTTQTKK